MTDTQNTLIPTVTVIVPDFAPFGFILQHGFKVMTATGCSLKEMLCNQFGIKSEYIDGRIKTAFLDGKPVDDYETAVIRDNMTLALSAAMPGLVGATFRSGGILSAFRSDISFRNTDASGPEDKKGWITIKIFNLLVKELGPGFLEKGITISTASFLELLQLLGENTGKIGIDGTLMDGQQAETFLKEGKITDILLIALKDAG